MQVPELAIPLGLTAINFEVRFSPNKGHFAASHLSEAAKTSLTHCTKVAENFIFTARGSPMFDMRSRKLAHH